MLVWTDKELSHWTILLHRGYSHRTCVSEHVTELCYWPTSLRIDFPARWGTAPLSSTGAWLLECKFFRYVDRKSRTPCLATQVIRFDPFGFFFWGFVKNVVYQGDRPTTLEELRGRITNAAALVTPQMLQNTWREVEYRLDVCRATHGAHIELHWPSSETRWVFISSYVKVYVNNPLFTLEVITYFSISLAWTSCITSTVHRKYLPYIALVQAPEYWKSQQRDCQH